MKSGSEKTILDWALYYYEQGWCVIPVPYGKKAACIRWRKFQTTRPEEKQLKRWFANKHRNIAVMLGEVSNGLACRDFDSVDEYRQWAAKHPELAKVLPTVQTFKGMHVYFEGHIQGIRHITNGELRGSRCYCLVPPSVHPGGQEYQWVNMPLNNNLLAVDAEIAGFIPNVTEQTEKTEQTEQTEAIVIEENKIDDAIERAIIETLPQEYGTRNRKIFEFVRIIKSLPQFADADPKELRDIVRAWHKRALPKIRTKEFEETWIDFLIAWHRIEYAKGEEPMAQIFEKAIQLEQPQVAVEKYAGHTKLRILVSLCRELQQAAGDSPFFLSVRTAGKLMGVSPMQAGRWLFLLESDGILKVVVKGGTAENPRKATRFRYIAN